MGLFERLRPPLDDGEIIDLYFARDERAIEETDRKYHKYLFAVAYNLLGVKEDCEECLNDTYAGAWEKMPPERPASLKAFLTVIIRRASMNVNKSNGRLKRGQSSLAQSYDELEAFIGEELLKKELEDVDLGNVINAYLLTLDKRRRYIFMSRYYMGVPIDALAQELSLSRSSVNKEIAAIKEGLKEALMKEGYDI